jgi:4a-hydroxytetrahydrobiopterin dehydratase
MKDRAFTKRDAEKKMKELDGWKLNKKGTEISKTYIFKNFREALRFVNKVGKIAEEANHHPDIMLSYGKVKVKLSTHSVGGLTKKDFDLAERVVDR